MSNQCVVCGTFGTHMCPGTYVESGYENAETLGLFEAGSEYLMVDDPAAATHSFQVINEHDGSITMSWTPLDGGDAVALTTTVNRVELEQMLALHDTNMVMGTPNE